MFIGKMTNRTLVCNSMPNKSKKKMYALFFNLYLSGKEFVKQIFHRSYMLCVYQVTYF